MITEEVRASIDRRLATLETVEDGWWHHEGKAVPKDVLEHVRQVVPSMINAGFIRPGLYPYAGDCGGICAEWNQPDARGDRWSISVEWHDGGLCLVHGLNVDTYGEFEFETRWNDDTYLEKLVKELMRVLR